MTWVSLHTHTEYSILDGASTLDELTDRAIELEMPALGISDHGNLFGAYKFWKTCRAKGLKPIIGMEAYVAPKSRHHKKPVYWGTTDQRKDDVGGRGAYTHMLLIAQDSEGLRNLYKLHNLAYLEGYYYKPRIDLELLEKYNAGVIGTTGCAGGRVPTVARLGLDIAPSLGTLQDIFEDRLYVELMFHDTDFDRDLNEVLTRKAVMYGIPVLATNDSHYTLASEAHHHEALLALQTRKTLADTNRFQFSGSGYHLRSREEMEATPLPRRAIEETLRVADRIGDYDDIFTPRSYAPKWDGDGTQRFKDLVTQGRQEKYSADNDEVDGRVEFESGVILGLGFPDYFAVLSGILGWAKRAGIMVGPGRGSATGSICAYLLNITDVDPLDYNLLFERFLNPKRVSAPDIDVDIQDDRRGEVFAYVQKEYGRNRVAHPVTFGIIKAKAALRDSARVLGHPYATGNRLSGMVPEPVLGRQHSLTGLDDIRKDSPEIYELALWLEGRIRQVSMHAAGLVISPVDLTEEIPVHTGATPDEDGASKDDLLVTGFPIQELEELGWLKYDLLGLKNLTIISDVLRMVTEDVQTSP